ncbi:TRAP transporter small permease [Chelativorans sp. YIM 93263]|uniref:TRAP transporter small permease n=1 Tax=Chelativorans sp. YIM 93263 TaxID=2906648 RepID=UPI002379F840|nr:TRAP transporter small permease [Chelativorans sp. YIM 93263]
MTAFTRFFDIALRGLDRLLIVLAVACLVILVGVVFAAVIMRYVLNTPMLFSFDLSTVLFAWIVFVGLIIADRDESHMGLDLISGLSSRALQNILIAIRYLLVLALSAYLAWIGYLLFQRTGAQISSLRISARWLYAAMPVGFGLLTLSYLGRIVRHLANWSR